MPASPKTDDRELRAITGNIEIRAAADAGAGRTAIGYAALFGVKSNVAGCWTEEFRTGAFSKSLRSIDVLALKSHDTARVVGRTGAGTLNLREDDKGVAFENQLPDTTDGNDIAVSVDRGDIPGMSFGFTSRQEEWDYSGDLPHRTVIEADLYEITYTPCPVYPDTTVGLRSLDRARAEERKTHNRQGWLSRKADSEQRFRRLPRHSGQPPEA